MESEERIPLYKCKPPDMRGDNAKSEHYWHSGTSCKRTCTLDVRRPCTLDVRLRWSLTGGGRSGRFHYRMKSTVVSVRFSNASTGILTLFVLSYIIPFNNVFVCRYFEMYTWLHSPLRGLRSRWASVVCGAWELFIVMLGGTGVITSCVTSPSLWTKLGRCCKGLIS